MTESRRIEGGVAAASGIGTGLARKASPLGMWTVLPDVNADQLNAFAATMEGDVLVAPTDVTDLSAVAVLAERACAAFGSVDLLFNNAGVMVTRFIFRPAGLTANQE